MSLPDFVITLAIIGAVLFIIGVVVSGRSGNGDDGAGWFFGAFMFLITAGLLFFILWATSIQANGVCNAWGDSNGTPTDIRRIGLEYQCWVERDGTWYPIDSVRSTEETP